MREKSCEGETLRDFFMGDNDLTPCPSPKERGDGVGWNKILF